MSTARTQLAALIREYGDDVPIGRGAALAAAIEHPGQSAEPMLDQLDAIASRLMLDETMSAFEVVARVNTRLFDDLGFAGDDETYDDPENSCLDSVLRRRKGLPLLLSIVYIEVAARAGRVVHPIGFPGHFLVGPEHDGRPFFVDPFSRGAILRESVLLGRVREEYGIREEDARLLLAPLSGRLVLYRLFGNLKNSWLRRADAAGALRAVEGMLMLAPERADQHRDRGLLLQQLGQVDEAIGALEHYLAACPDAMDAEDVAAHVDRLRLQQA